MPHASHCNASVATPCTAARAHARSIKPHATPRHLRVMPLHAGLMTEPHVTRQPSWQLHLQVPIGSRWRVRSSQRHEPLCWQDQSPTTRLSHTASQEGCGAAHACKRVSLVKAALSPKANCCWVNSPQPWAPSAITPRRITAPTSPSPLSARGFLPPAPPAGPGARARRPGPSRCTPAA